jgi:hypothetical protein
MLLAPNRRRTRRRISSFKRGVSSKDYCSHIKLDGWKNAYLSANPDLIPFEGRGRKPAAELSENQRLGFLHRLKGYILARVAAGNDYRHGDTSSELNAISRQTENSFRQSQTILRDLKHHSLPKRHYSFWEWLNGALDLRFTVQHYSPTLSALDSHVKSRERDPIDSSADL